MTAPRCPALIFFRVRNRFIHGIRIACSFYEETEKKNVTCLYYEDFAHHISIRANRERSKEKFSKVLLFSYMNVGFSPLSFFSILPKPTSAFSIFVGTL